MAGSTATSCACCPWRQSPRSVARSRGRPCRPRAVAGAAAECARRVVRGRSSAEDAIDARRRRSEAVAVAAALVPIARAAACARPRFVDGHRRRFGENDAVYRSVGAVAARPVHSVVVAASVAAGAGAVASVAVAVGPVESAVAVAVAAVDGAVAAVEAGAEAPVGIVAAGVAPVEAIAEAGAVAVAVANSVPRARPTATCQKSKCLVHTSLSFLLNVIVSMLLTTLRIPSDSWVPTVLTGKRTGIVTRQRPLLKPLSP